MNYKYIETAEQLDAWVEGLDGHPLLGIDTEAAGYHRYLDRLSLVQISSRDANILIDPFALPDLSALAPGFADPGTEKIFHDADYDLRILDRDAGLSIRGLFDTQIAAAFLGERALGLGAVIENYLGIKIPKAFQRADWAKRPLPEEMKDYAATDTVHLPALRDRLKAALEERGRLGWAEEEFRRREPTRWTETGEDPDAFMRVKGARDLTPRELAVLRELYSWREGVARERDQATFRVLNNQPLIELSARAPTDQNGFTSVPGVGTGLARHHGGEILAAIQRGREVPERDLPHFPRRPERRERDPELEARTDRLRAVRNREAQTLNLDPGFLMPRGLLKEIASHGPATIPDLMNVPNVRQWQVEAIGESLLGALRRG